MQSHNPKLSNSPTKETSPSMELVPRGYSASSSESGAFGDLDILSDIEDQKEELALALESEDQAKARLVREGVMLGSGQYFPWAKYKASAAFIGTVVGIDVLYTVFLGDTEVSSITYVLEIERTQSTQNIILAATSPFLLSNLYVDETAFGIADEASGMILAKSKFVQLFKDHPKMGTASQMVSKGAFYLGMATALPSYIGLSSPDGVSLGLFGAPNPVIFAGCGLFGIAGTTYYTLMLNPRRADHIVSFVDGLLDSDKSMLMDLVSQPLMTLEAMHEIGIVVSFRTLLAVFSIYLFLTDTLKVSKESSAVSLAMATVGASTLLDALTTRTKQPLVDNLQYRDLGFTKFSFRAEDGSYFQLEKGPLLTLTAEDKQKICEKFSKRSVAFDAFLSLVRGAALAAIVYNHMSLEKVIGLGAAVALHAFYAKSMRQVCSAMRAIETEAKALEAKNRQRTFLTLEVIEDEKATPLISLEEKAISLAEQAAKDKEEKFKKIISFYETDTINKIIFAPVLLGRVARFLALPISIVSLNKQFSDWGLWNDIGMQPLEKAEILAITTFLGVPVLFYNEMSVYYDSIKKSNPELFARIKMEANSRQHLEAGFFGRVTGYAKSIFKPRETYNTADLEREIERLEAKAAAPATVASRSSRWNICATLFGRRDVVDADEATGYALMEPEPRQKSRCVIM